MKVNLPDGTVANFPDGTPPEVITKAVQNYLMESNVAIGEAGAVAGAKARGAEGSNLAQGSFGSAAMDAIGADVPKAEALTPTLIGGSMVAGAPTSWAQAGRMALGAAGAEVGSRYGGPVAAKVGLPPVVGQVGGAVIGALAPEGAMARMAFRGALPAIVKSVAVEESPLVANLTKTFMEGGLDKAKALEVAKSQVAKMMSAEAAPAVAKAAPAVAEAAAPVAAGATRQAALTQFAKEVATKNPKIGEKIWILLDEAGNPVKTLTPYQAGAALRAGEKTTWVKNIYN